MFAGVLVGRNSERIGGERLNLRNKTTDSVSAQLNLNFTNHLSLMFTISYILCLHISLSLGSCLYNSLVMFLQVSDVYLKGKFIVHCLGIAVPLRMGFFVDG